MPTLGLGRLDRDRLGALLRDQAGAALTYPDVGATRGRSTPAGYHGSHHAVMAGTGEDAFASLRDGVLRFDVHRGAGLRVVATTPTAEPGTDVVVAIPFGPLATAVACCRVVYRIDEPARAGFAYGTLPDYPESGEEAFLVARQPSGDVRFEVIQFSRPATTAGRALTPFHRTAQAIVTRRYLAAASRIARSRSTAG